METCLQASKKDQCLFYFFYQFSLKPDQLQCKDCTILCQPSQMSAEYETIFQSHLWNSSPTDVKERHSFRDFHNCVNFHFLFIYYLFTIHVCLSICVCLVSCLLLSCLRVYCSVFLFCITPTRDTALR